jgi:hypothetical protein
MRNAVDLLGVLLLGISGAALLVVAVLAVAGFASGDTGVGFLFSALAIIILPLVAFAAWRAFQLLWQLGREMKILRAEEARLRAVVEPLPAPPSAGPGARAAAKTAGPKAATAKAAQPKASGPPANLPPGRSPTGWRAPPPSAGLRDVLSTRQVGWRVVLGIGIVMLLFAAGVLAGVLARV